MMDKEQSKKEESAPNADREIFGCVDYDDSFVRFIERALTSPNLIPASLLALAIIVSLGLAVYNG